MATLNIDLTSGGQSIYSLTCGYRAVQYLIELKSWRSIKLDMQASWASEASPTLGCSIEISRDICMYICVSVVGQNA